MLNKVRASKSKKIKKLLLSLIFHSKKPSLHHDTRNRKNFVTANFFLGQCCISNARCCDRLKSRTQLPPSSWIFIKGVSHDSKDTSVKVKEEKSKLIWNIEQINSAKLVWTIISSASERTCNFERNLMTKTQIGANIEIAANMQNCKFEHQIFN